MASLDAAAAAVADTKGGRHEIGDDDYDDYDEEKEERERERRRRSAALLWEKMRSAASLSTRSGAPTPLVVALPAHVEASATTARPDGTRPATSATSAAVRKSAAVSASEVGRNDDTPEPLFVWNDDDAAAADAADAARDERKTTPEHTVFVVSGVAATAAAEADVPADLACTFADVALGANPAPCHCTERADDRCRPAVERAHDPARDDDKNSVEKTQRQDGDGDDDDGRPSADGDMDTSELEASSHLSIDASGHAAATTAAAADDETVVVGLFGEIIASPPPRVASTRWHADREPIVNLRIDTSDTGVPTESVASVAVATDRGALPSVSTTDAPVDDNSGGGSSSSGSSVETPPPPTTTALKNGNVAEDDDDGSEFGVETAFHETTRRRRLLAAQAMRQEVFIQREAPTDARVSVSPPKKPPSSTRAAEPAGISRERLRQADADAAVRAAEVAAERKRAYRAEVLALGGAERKAAEDARRHQVKLRAELDRKATAAVALAKKNATTPAAEGSSSPKSAALTRRSASSKTGDRKKRSVPKKRAVHQKIKTVSHPLTLVRSPPPPPPPPPSTPTVSSTAAALYEKSPRLAAAAAPPVATPLPSAVGSRVHSWKDFSSRPRAPVGESDKAPDLLLTLFAVQSGAPTAESHPVEPPLDASSASADGQTPASSIANTESKRSGGVKRKEAPVETARSDDRRPAPTISRLLSSSLSLSAETNADDRETGTSGDSVGARPSVAAKRLRPTVASSDETRERREAEDETRWRAAESTGAEAAAEAAAVVDTDANEKDEKSEPQAEERAELKREMECIDRRVTSLVRYCERQRPTASAIEKELAEMEGPPENATTVGVRHHDLVRYAHAHICASLAYSRLKIDRLRAERRVLNCHYNNNNDDDDAASAVHSLQELSHPYHEGVYIRRILNLERKLYVRCCPLLFFFRIHFRRQQEQQQQQQRAHASVVALSAARDAQESSRENKTPDRTDAEAVAFRSPFFVDDLGKLFGSSRHKWRALIRVVIRRRRVVGSIVS